MRKLTVIVTLLCVAPLPSAAGAAAGGGAPLRWVERTLASMTLDEKIGQMIMGGTGLQTFRNPDSDDYTKMRHDVVDLHLGGYHVHGGDPSAVALMINELQRSAKVPLLIADNFEGGAGWVFQGATRFPMGMALGATDNPQYAYEVGKITAEEGRAIGVNVNFYPVADVNNNPGNPIINIRSFGENPERVSAFVREYIRGAQENGQIATAKHFPGHGDVATDSHLQMPVLDVSRDRLEHLELPPFRAAVDENVAAVMTAHIDVPSVEPEKGLPSTLSRNVITGILRDELHFAGVVFTDSMGMRGITANFTEEDASVRAVLAGADVVLGPPSTDVAFNAIKSAVQSGKIAMSRIDDSVRRILTAKARIGLDRYKPVDVNRLAAVVGTKAHRDLAQEITEASVTLVRDEQHVLPLAPGAKRVLHINLLDSRSGWREGPVGKVTSAEMLKRFPNAITIQLDDTSNRNELDMAREMAGLVDAVVVTAFIRVAAYKGSIDLAPEQVRFLRDLSAMKTPFVFALFGSPYVIHHIPELPSYILTYDTSPASELAAIKAITGEIPFRGKLPITLPVR
ncbi:MAG TPA: glycoside hydrolase family 3 protein [Thermoanaerobaculia bacterium]|nr:glycoside hydrolase family 3 protein [Thermoanaerobaculia bacterium]